MAKLTQCNHCHKLIPQVGKHDCPNKPKRNVKSTADMTELELLILKYEKSSSWAKKRKYIKQRDGEYCQRCKIKYNIIVTKKDAQLDVHHIYAVINMNIEQVKRMYFDDDNLITVCHTCNMQLGTKGVLDFIWTPPKYEPNL